MRLFRRSHDVPTSPPTARLRRGWLLAAFAAFAIASASGCKGKGNTLTPPRGADEWEAEYSRHFDDGLTEIPIRLQGRAPNDVRDQKRFGQRLGLADIVVLTKVSQTWSRGLQGRRQSQFIEIELGRVLLGDLPARVASEQTLEIRTGQELPTNLQGQSMILFIRWAPGEQPPFHHHLLLATDELISTIDTMVKHAKREGQLGSAAERRRARRDKERAKSEEQGAEGELDEGDEPVADDGAQDAPEE